MEIVAPLRKRVLDLEGSLLTAKAELKLQERELGLVGAPKKINHTISQELYEWCEIVARKVPDWGSEKGQALSFNLAQQALKSPEWFGRFWAQADRAGIISPPRGRAAGLPEKDQKRGFHMPSEDQVEKQMEMVAES